MLFEVYYKVYELNRNGAYKEGPKSIPYAVRDTDSEKRKAFCDLLVSEGFECVSWNDSYPVILVNLEFKRFGLVYRAACHECVGQRLYTIQEFFDEVYYV